MLTVVLKATQRIGVIWPVFQQHPRQLSGSFFQTSKCLQVVCTIIQAFIHIIKYTGLQERIWHVVLMQLLGYNVHLLLSQVCVIFMAFCL